MPLDLSRPDDGALMIRPIVGTDDRLYSPDSDLAYATPGLVYVALEALQRDRWEPYFGDDLVAHNITEAELLEGAARFACVVKDMAVDPDCKGPGAVFQKHEFQKCHPAVQRAVFARVGQVMVSAYFKAVRMALPVGGEASVKPRLDDLTKAARDALTEARVRAGKEQSVWYRLRRATAYVFNRKPLEGSK